MRGAIARVEQKVDVVLADLGLMKDAIARVEQKVDGLRGELDIAKDMLSLVEQPGSASSQPASGRPGIAAQAIQHMMAILKRLVEQHSEEAPVAANPEDLLACLTDPMGKDKLAAAYNMVCKDVAKPTARLLRDALLLQMVSVEGQGMHWDYDSLIAALDQSFDPVVDDDTMSQLVQAFCKIREFGMDRLRFNAQIASEAGYGHALEEQVADTIFDAFAECSRNSPGFVSRGKGTGRKPMRPAKRDRNAGRHSAWLGAPPGLTPQWAWPGLTHWAWLGAPWNLRPGHWRTWEMVLESAPESAPQ